MFEEIINEKWEEILDLCENAEKQAMRSPLSGWTVDVIVEKNGDVYLDGPRSYGTQTTQEWDGDAIAVYSAKCGEFDIDYMLDCVNWPDSMIEFVEAHRVKTEDEAVYGFWLDGEQFFFDEQLPREVELDFIEEYASSLDYESKIFVE